MGGVWDVRGVMMMGGWSVGWETVSVGWCETVMRGR